MNIVINPTKCTKTSITASNRIATWIAATLGYRLVDDAKTAKQALDYKIGKVFVVNGMFGFCDFREEIAKLCKQAQEVVWIGNDYAIKLPSNLSFLKESSKFKRIAQYSNFDGMKNHAYVDFNKLLHWDGEKQDYQFDGVIYYGAFRNDRLASFQTWLKPSAYPVHVSTAARNFAEFSEINPKLRLYSAGGDIRKVLPKFQSSIYIEDNFSHKNPMSPANRFYECIGSKILLFYDTKCKQTLTNAGYWDDAFAVDSPEQLATKLKDYDSLREKQIQQFKDRDFRAELKQEFLKSL